MLSQSRPSLRLLLAVGLLIAAGCDQSFSPIQPSDLRFSVFGYLNASADTQWIRVTPVRPELPTEPGPSDVRVTMEDTGTGRTTELTDSVFRFSRGSDAVGSEGAYLHNFWTTEKIRPDAKYHVTVSRDGGPPAEADVTIPPDYAVEVWIKQPRTSGKDSLRIEGLRHLAFVQLQTSMFGACGEVVEKGFFALPYADADVQTVPVSKLLRTNNGCKTTDIENDELLVMGSGEPWPGRDESSISTLGPRDLPSNVTNAVGFIGGILTKTVPYEECTTLTSAPTPAPCRLRYDASTVTLRGVLRDTLCGGPPAQRATIRLTETDPVPPFPAKVRTTRSDHTGAYRISGLETGHRYALSIRALTSEMIELYEEHIDTLEFAPGEQARHDAGLRRLQSCEEPV